MSADYAHDAAWTVAGQGPGIDLSSIPDDSLVEALVDSLSIESLNLSLAGLFDGFSVVLFNEWASRAGPLVYAYSLYELVYEKADLDLEKLVEELGEDGLHLILSLPFKREVSREEELAAYQLLGSFFKAMSLEEEYEKVLRDLEVEASRKGRPRHQIYSSLVAHMINKALNSLVPQNE